MCWELRMRKRPGPCMQTHRREAPRTCTHWCVCTSGCQGNNKTSPLPGEVWLARSSRAWREIGNGALVCPFQQPGQKLPGQRVPPHPGRLLRDGVQSWQTGVERWWQRPTSGNHLSASTSMLENTSSPVRGPWKERQQRLDPENMLPFFTSLNQKVTSWISWRIKSRRKGHLSWL